jgi:hypothetical protein
MKTTLNFCLSTISTWWQSGNFPNDKLKAHTASIYKKGDPKKQENYRPISLSNSCYKIYVSLLQTRIATTIDRFLMKTQYGFRKSRSTVIPLACIRRLCERAEASIDEMRLVFLDWAKAFDKILHDQLFWALDILAFPAEYIAAISSLYKDPVFSVEIQHNTSSWHQQHCGIRQGCPLSPYLVVCVMHVLSEEVYAETNLINHRLDGLDFNELAFADDTALITPSVRAMSKLLKSIEQKAARFDFFLSRTKCVCLSFNSNAQPKFADGTAVPTEGKTKYLGGVIHKRHNINGEIQFKIGSCFAIRIRSNFFWRTANCLQNSNLMLMTRSYVPN